MTVHITDQIANPTVSSAPADDFGMNAWNTRSEPPLPPPALVTPAVTLRRQVAEAEARTLYCLEAHGEASPEYREALMIEMALYRAQVRQNAEMGSSALADIHDAALLDEVFGLTVVFLNPCIPMYHAAEPLEGVILDVKTSPRGKRQLLVKANELNLPKWIDVNAVQFTRLSAQKAALEATAASVAGGVEVAV